MFAALSNRKLLITLSIFIAAIPAAVGAVGVTPSVTVVDHLANGVVVKKTIFLTRSPSDEVSRFKVSENGPGAKYIDYENEILEFKQGEFQVPFTFTIKPDTAPTGEHHVRFTFVSLPPETAEPHEGSVLSIGVGAEAEVRFEIVDERIESFEVLGVGIDPAEEGQPMVFQYQLRNTGNVDTRPYRVVVKLVDQSDPNYVITEELQGDELQFVDVAQEQSFSFKLKTPIPQGKYLVSVEFFNKDGVRVFEKKADGVTVFAPGTLDQSAVFEDFMSSGDTFEPNQLIKFDVRIQNNGDLLIVPTVYIEIKKPDGQLFDLLRPEVKSIPRAQDTVYTITTRIPEESEYVADAYFDYGIKRSETKTIAFQVKKKSFFSSLGVGHAVSAGIVLTALVGGGVFLGMKRKKVKYAKKK